MYPSVEDTRFLMSSPQRDWAKKQWRWFVAVQWDFALRPGELWNVQSCNVYKKTSDVWFCEVRTPKVRNKVRYQTIAIKESWIPADFLIEISEFAKAGLETWSRDIYKTKICDHAKRVLSFEGEFKMHLLRHSRATNLLKEYHLSLDELQKIGRWVNRSSMMRYIHC